MAAPGPGPGQMNPMNQMGHHNQMQQMPPQGMHPQQAQMNPGQPQPAGLPQQAQQQSQMESDPVAKFKSLLPRLKEALQNLFKVGGHLFYQNASQDETGHRIENVTGRFEKCLEEFYAICDQIEINLRLANEIVHQDRDSRLNTPISVLPQKTEGPQQDGQLYSQYLSTVRAQINCAKDIRDLLHDCMKSLSEHPHP